MTLQVSAWILAYVGLSHWYQGDLARAEQGFDAAYDVLAGARRLAPDDPQLLFQLSTVENNNGHVLEARGQIDQATGHYRRMLEAAQRLTTLAPDEDDWQNQLALAHNNLAKMALLGGNLSMAIEGYRRQVAIQRALAARDPRNNAQRRGLLIARFTLGRTLALMGQAEEGRRLMQQALDEARALHAMEPSSTDFQSDVGLYALQLARLERQLGNSESALQLAQESAGLFDALVRASKDQPTWQSRQAEAITERAHLAIAAGTREGDLDTQLRKALQTLEAQLAQSPQDRSSVLATVDARLRLAAISSDPERTRLATTSLATIEAQASARNDPRLRVLEADALRQLGRRADASAVDTALRASGYRAPAVARVARAAAASLNP